MGHCRPRAWIVIAVLIASAGHARAERRVDPGRVAVRVRAGAPALGSRAAPSAVCEQLGALGYDVITVAPSTEMRAASLLAGSPLVRAATPIYLYAAAFVPDDPFFTSAWHHADIGSTTAWNRTIGGAAHVIAIVDTGVDAVHPDLRGRVLPGYNFADGNTNTLDPHGHGTAVAGAAAATGNNATGVAGLVWTNRILPVRVATAKGVASSDRLAAGIRWAADRGARIINVSFGPLQGDVLVSAAARYARSRGALVFAAAGNDARSVAGALDPWILYVAATDRTGRRALFSSYGPSVRLAAPGVSIATTVPRGGYAAFSGTSFSSPVAAGVAALAWSTNPALPVDEVEALLLRTCRDVGPPGRDEEHGAGRVDAAAAVAAASARGALGAVPPPDTQPPTVAIQRPLGGTVAGAVTVSVSASDDRAVRAVTLLVDGAGVASESAAPYTFSWNTRTAHNGPHALTAVARDTAGNASTSAPVGVTVANDPPRILLVTPRTGNMWAGMLLSVMWRASGGASFRDAVVLVDGTPRTAPQRGLRTAGAFTVARSAAIARGVRVIQVRGTTADGLIVTSDPVSVVRP